MILLPQPSELHGLNHPAHLSCFFLACRELAKLCVQGIPDAAEEIQKLLGFSVVLRSAMLPFHGDPSFWLLTFRCINTEGLNSRRAAPDSLRKNCGGRGVRNPSQVQHLLGFVYPSILRVAGQRAIKNLIKDKIFFIFLWVGCGLSEARQPYSWRKSHTWAMEALFLT